MEDDFKKRVDRLYAAIGEVEVTDLTRFPPKVGPQDTKHVFQDFSGGLSAEHIENLAHSAIANVANLKDHARKFAKMTGRDSGDVDRAIAQSEGLRLLLDLADREKHGGDRRDGGYSGHNPRLGKLIRGLEMRSLTGGPVELTFGPSGPIASPEGALAVVLTAQILDAQGKTVGYLKEALKEGMKAWEELFREWGIIASAA
jgi:hypothetical protein